MEGWSVNHRKKRVLIISCVPILAAGFFFFSGNASPPPSATPDDIWARALLAGTCEYDRSWPEIDRFFAMAAIVSPNKAPIYLLWGDFLEDFHQDESPDFASLSPRVEYLRNQYADDPNALLAVMMADRSALADGRFETWADAYLRLTGEDERTAIKKPIDCYRRAIKADPDFSLAWFRLYFKSEETGDVATMFESAARLLTNESDNALAYYLAASLAIDHEDHSVALRLVQAGNRTIHAEHFACPGPESLNLMYPLGKPYASWGVSGDPVPYKTLMYSAVDSRICYTPTFHLRVRNLHRVLLMQAETLTEQGFLELAREYLEASAEMGLHWSRTSPPNFIDVATGWAVFVDASVPLATLYRKLSLQERLKSLESIRQYYQEEIRAAMTNYTKDYSGYVDARERSVAARPRPWPVIRWIKRKLGGRDNEPESLVQSFRCQINSDFEWRYIEPFVQRLPWIIPTDPMTRVQPDPSDGHETTIVN